MASFTGRKVKDSYGEALKVSTGSVDGTLKTVEDGLGNDSALEISNNSVKSTGNLESDGSLNVSGETTLRTVNLSTTDVKALVVDSNGLVLYRDLGTGAFEPQFDSGWRDLDTYGDGTLFGLPTYSDKPNYAQYRVVNRTVFFRGNIYIPLTDGAGGYVNPYSGTITSNESGISSSNGWTISAGNSIITPNLTGNSTIAPDNNIVFKDRIGSRLIRSGNSSDGLRLYTLMSIFLNTDGTISLQSIKDVEEPSTGGISSSQIFQDQRRYLISKVEAGDYALDWQNYRTSSNGSNTFYNTWSHGTNTYPFAFDGTNSSFLGGIDFNIDGIFYQISESTPISAIQASLAN